MKIAIGIKDKDSKELYGMFARSPLFVILDIEDKKIESEKFEVNNFSNQTSGAGTAVIEQLATLGVDAIICLNLGPRALDLSRQLQLRAYKTDESSMDKAMNLFFKGSLEELK